MRDNCVILVLPDLQKAGLNMAKINQNNGDCTVSVSAKPGYRGKETKGEGWRSGTHAIQNKGLGI